MTCSEEYFVLLMDILPSWEMWKDLFHHFAVSEMVTGSVAICCGTGLFAPRADRSLLMPKNTSLILKLVEAECHWYDYLGHWWELHLSHFPRMQPGTSLRSNNSPFQITEPRSGRTEKMQLLQNKGITGKKPHSNKARENHWCLA